MAIEVRKITSRDEWLSWRKADITGSGIGALFNCHPYTTALRLYAEKRGTQFLHEDNKVMRRGRWMEPAVAAAVMETRPEWQLIKATEYYRDSVLCLGATPDFDVVGDPLGRRIICETKTVAPSVYERDWNAGLEVPLWIILQAQVAGMLTNADIIVIAALLVDAHNMELAIHELPRHEAAEQKIRDAVALFWLDVETGREPDPDFARDADTIKAMWKRERPPPNEIDLSGNNNIQHLLIQRCNLKDTEKYVKSQLEKIDAEIKYEMKDAAVATGIEDFGLTYKTSSVKEFVMPAREQRTLRVTDRREKI